MLVIHLTKQATLVYNKYTIPAVARQDSADCALFRLLTPLRSKQDKEREYRPQGVYNEVHDQGGTERDAVLRRL